MPNTMIRCSIALAILTASLSCCSEEDSSAVSARSWSQAGGPAPASSSSSNPLVMDAINALLNIALSGTYENVSHATGNNSGQLTGSVAFAYRYTFSTSHFYESCVTKRLVGPQRYRDSGTYTVQAGTIRLDAREAGSSVMTFEYDDNLQTLWLDGKKFTRVTDGQLCD